MTAYLIHTDAPAADVLLIGDGIDGKLDLGRTPRGEPDCFYGWSEPWHPDPTKMFCRPHHIVSEVDEDGVLYIASTLEALGHQVVVTRISAVGNEEALAAMPYHYDHDHTH